MRNKIKIALFVIFSFFSYQSYGETYLQLLADENKRHLLGICDSLSGSVQCRSGVIEDGQILFSWISFLSEDEQKPASFVNSAWSFAGNALSWTSGQPSLEKEGDWITLYSFKKQENTDDPSLRPIPLDSIYKDFADCNIGWKLLIPEKIARFCGTTPNCASGYVLVPEEDKIKMRKENSDTVRMKRKKMIKLLEKLDIEAITDIEDKLNNLFPKDATHGLSPSRGYAVDVKRINNTAKWNPVINKGLVFLDANGHAHSALQEKKILNSITLSLKNTHNDWKCSIDDASSFYDRSRIYSYIDENNKLNLEGNLWNGLYRPEEGGLFRVMCGSDKVRLQFRQMFFGIDGKAIPLSFTPEGGYPRWRCNAGSDG